MKQRNPNWGCPRIAQHIALSFHIQIDKDVVRRILARHHRSGQDSGGPYWLTFLGHMKDSLWSMDLFRCESATLRTHWVLVVMDQYSRRIIGFGVHAGKVDGVGLCRMFNRAIREQRWMPNYISSDNDPLYRFHQWQALKDNFQDRGDCQNTRKSATTFVSQNPVRFAGLTGHQS